MLDAAALNCSTSNGLSCEISWVEDPMENNLWYSRSVEFSPSPLEVQDCKSNCPLNFQFKIHSSIMAFTGKNSQNNTPWKLSMEPTNHPFRKETDLPNLHDYVLAVTLQGCSAWNPRDFVCCCSKVFDACHFPFFD